MTEPNRHDHISGRPRNDISRKWFHRGRHRVGDPVSDIAKRINSEYFGEYDPELPCPHDNRKITYETEDFYSNGMFGIPAFNRPTIVDMYEKTTCTDCGKELFSDSVTGAMACDAKQGWHTDDDD